MDLTSNDLTTLPPSLDFFYNLERLNLASNNFSSDSVLVDPANILKSIFTVPYLRFLGLAHNKFSELIIDEETLKTLNLEELDLSFNDFHDMSELLICAQMPKLKKLIVSGNPGSARVSPEYEKLEMELRLKEVSCQLINININPSGYIAPVSNDTSQALVPMQPHIETAPDRTQTTKKLELTAQIEEAEPGKEEDNDGFFITDG